MTIDTAEIRRHLAAMTPGVWEQDGHDVYAEVSDPKDCICVCGDIRPENAAGIALLHNNAEAMADEIDALRAAMKRLREASQQTLRRFAIDAGVSPTQMSEWTSDPIATQPDLVD